MKLNANKNIIFQSFRLDFEGNNCPLYFCFNTIVSSYSTVTDFAKFLGLSILHPLCFAI